jgi:hypothetical protein
MALPPKTVIATALILEFCIPYLQETEWLANSVPTHLEAEVFLDIRMAGLVKDDRDLAVAGPY